MGGTLRLNMSADQLAQPGKLLIRLAEERRLRGDV
jgi:hypothetical protein